MLTYALMALPFLTVALWLGWRRKVLADRHTWLVLAGLLLLTATFDQLLVRYVVGYDPGHIAGLYIGRVPIEDFSYTIAVVIGMGALVRHEQSKK